MRIKIYDRLTKTRLSADFAVARQSGRWAIGWASITTESANFRFPTVIHTGNDWVATVADWQGPFCDVDLADPESVATLASTGQGTFISAKTGRPSEAWRKFAGA